MDPGLHSGICQREMYAGRNLMLNFAKVIMLIDTLEMLKTQHKEEYDECHGGC